MHKTFLSLFLLGLMGVSSAQQAKPPAQISQPQAPLATFSKTAELVTIPVVVIDKKGLPVIGLTKDDFVVQENGKTTREIASFEAVETSPTASQSDLQLAAGEYSNFTRSIAQPTRITIIVLDMINTPFTSQARVKAELLKFLANNLRGDEPTALLTIGRNGVRQIHPFTSDPQILITALKKVTSSLSNMDINEIQQDNPSDPSNLTDEEQQLEQFQRDNEAMANAFFQKNAIRDTMASMEQIAQAYAGLPGRKVMLWASSGFPFLIEDPQSIVGMGTDMVSDYERVWHAMNAANIAIYPINSEGLENPTFAAFDVTKRNAPFPTRGTRVPQRPVYDKYQQRRDTMKSFAEATGGKPCMDRNDLATCFDLALRDSNSYYMLAYYLPEEDRKPGWHKLKVTVKKKDVNVRARSGFLVPEKSKQPADSLKTELFNAFHSPLDYTGLPLFVRWTEKKPDPKDEQRVRAFFEVAMSGTSLIIDPGDNNHINLEVAALAYDDKGKIVGEMSKTIDGRLKADNADTIRKNGLRYRDEIGLPKGKYTVKVVVRDDLAGKVGSVSVPVTVN